MNEYDNDKPSDSRFGRQVDRSEKRDYYTVDDDQPVLEKPPRRRRSLRSNAARGGLVRFFNFLMTLAILGVIGFFASVWYSKTQFDAPGPLTQETTFTVPKGATFNSIVPGLEAKGIIPKQGPLRIFTRGVQSAGKASELKAGEFGFKPGMTMREVMLQVTEGRAIEYALSLPEGLTSYQIMERIQFSEALTGDLPAIPAEGSLLPDTYLFPRGTTREQAVERIKAQREKALAEVWESRAEDLPLETPEELAILASIVEKETGVGSERAHVASVFVNRLRKGMKLQTDPTVMYGIWGGQGKPKDRGGLRVSELKRSTPYNTYIIKGLPPTPIANPGIEALKAVANPLQTDDLFFVADGTGGHVFAKTLKQHNSNVAKWRKIEAKRIKEAKEAAAAAAEEAKKNGDTLDQSN